MDNLGVLVHDGTGGTPTTKSDTDLKTVLIVAAVAIGLVWLLKKK